MCVSSPPCVLLLHRMLPPPCSDVPPPPPRMLPRMLHRTAPHAAPLHQAAKLSSFQLEVSDALGQLGIEHELEHLTAVNLLSVDIAVMQPGGACARGRVGWWGGGAGRLLQMCGRLPMCPNSAPHYTHPCPSPLPPPHTLPPLAGRKVAIEVDGPYHFSVNTNSPLGQTMIRRRLLRAVGWNVISVPFHAW